MLKNVQIVANKICFIYIMNKTTNYVLTGLALFFGISIFMDRLKMLPMFEGMENTEEKDKNKDNDKEQESLVTKDTPIVTYNF